MATAAPSAWECCPAAGLSQRGHSWHGTAAAEQRGGVTGQGNGGSGRAAPGTVPGRVRAQLVWLG